MGIQQQFDQVREIREGLEQARDELNGEIDEGLTQGEHLRDAARRIGESSSGSWVGWHSRMYYRGFNEPPIAETWSTEWGGIHGFSDAWEERSQSEIQDAVEERAGLRLADLAAIADRVRLACEPLHQELLTILSPICDLAGLEREGRMLKEVETVEWIVPPGQFAQAMAPNQMMSRDSEALHQGMQAPLHLNVETAIVSNTSTMKTSRDFLASGIRLTRQAEAKLGAISEGRGATVGPTGIAVDPRTAKQLHLRSVALFVLLALLVAGGVVLGLREVDGAVAIAVLLVVATLAVAGFYALLLNRRHAVRALVITAGVVGAVAGVQELLEGVSR